jgi:alkylation response protein AidB-like acyl-CoA dehydrogenase
MNPYVIPWMDDDLEVFRDTVVRFIETEMVPHDARWREQHHVDRETWRKAGDTGLLLLDVPAEYGGGGGDFRHEAVMYTELARRGIGAFGQGVHSMCAHYVLNHGTEAQKQRWLPRLAAGELVGAICMTEPGTGSDLKGIRTRAVKQGDHYVVDGGKTFITNGWLAGLLMLVVRTDTEDRNRGLSILMVETKDLAGYRVGRVLDKMGLHGQDTSELFFEGVQVPADCLLGGEEGRGMHQLMHDLPYERTCHRRGRGRRHGRRRRRDIEIRARAQDLRPAGVELPEHALQAGRAREHHARGARVLGSLHRRPGRREIGHRDRVDGQAVDHRHAAAGARRMRAAARGLRLHERVSRLPPVRRFARAAHLWRHERDHERGHRARACNRCAQSANTLGLP